MLLSDVSIRRPVFASVLSLLLIIFGIVAFDRLSLREYPDIDPPIVTVEVIYPGAPANIVETRITEVIEERIAGVEGIKSIESSSRDGIAAVTIEFTIDRDIDAAANDIRDRVAGVQDVLPEEAEPAEVQKVDSNSDVIIWQNLTGEGMTTVELLDYAERYLLDRYSALSGVARIRTSGATPYALRIWLDRQALAARNLTAADVEAALRRDNLELPGGSLESSTRLFTARVQRNFRHVDDFKSLVLATGDNGYLVRLSDVARVELGEEESRTFFRGNSIPMIGIGVIKQSTANTIEVARAARALTDLINQELPQGMFIEKSFDSSLFIEYAIDEVYKTLFFSIFCVIVVIYLFLGNFRAMLIPAVTVPVSITATFIVIYALGFSINILTLLALVLAIGLVVDDTIVVLENISRRVDEHEPVLLAAFRGTRQVGFAVIATTLVLASVFVPITFLGGDLGRLFTEFALTIVAAVVFSSLIALTLSPMLASKLLKQTDQPNALVSKLDAGIQRLRDRYIDSLQQVLDRPRLALLGFLILLGASGLLLTQIGQEYAPWEDRGFFFSRVTGPEGASFSYTKDYMTDLEGKLMPLVENGEVQRLLLRAPLSFNALESFNAGILIAVLEPWGERRGAQAIIADVRRALAELPGVRGFPIVPQGLSQSSGSPVQFVLSGPTYEELVDWRDILLNQINADPQGLVNVDSDFKETRPQIDFNINYDRAAELGVSTIDIGRTLETMLGGREVTTFLDRGEEYEVIIEGERRQQRTFSDIGSIYVRSRNGQLVPLNNVITIAEYGAAQTLPRYNRLRSITIEASLAEDYPIGEALDYLNQLADTYLPETAVISYKGESLDYVTAGSSILFVFGLGLVIVFLVLAAQFESWIHPFIIILTVPLAIGGGLLGLWLTGGTLNIYSQIGLLILIGLAAKNGILIVEFANQRREENIAFDQALLEAAQVRFRPILMTGLTTAAGAIPLILASGAGAETRTVIGIVMLSGVIAATLFTLFVVPVAYQLLARRTQAANAVTKELERLQASSGTP